jgi:Mg2+/Co2+ transporter CorB
VSKDDGKTLPGWTLLVNIAAPVMATMILVSCRDFGLSWAIGIPAAVVVVVGGLLWERSIERRYIRPRRRR